MKKLTASLALCALFASSGAAQAALIDRGGGLIYDDVLNVTWLQDANYAKTSGYDADGMMTWSQATIWASSLSYLDSVRNVTYTDWRLPTVTDTGTSGCNFAIGGTDCGYNVDTATGEMARLFFDELHNKSYINSSGAWEPRSGLTNSGPFGNLQSSDYWYGTELNTSSAWYFYFNRGIQDAGGKYNNYFAMAVRPGDVTTVPVPAAAWLLGSGLLGMFGVAKRKSNS